MLGIQSPLSLAMVLLLIFLENMQHMKNPWTVEQSMFFKRCPFEFSMIFRIIVDPGWPKRSCHARKFVGPIIFFDSSPYETQLDL